MSNHSHHKTHGLDNTIKERQEQDVQDQEKLRSGSEPHLEQLLDIQFGRSEFSRIPAFQARLTALIVSRVIHYDNKPCS